jgi:hypothetical protein
MKRNHIFLLVMATLAVISSVATAEVQHNGEWWREQGLSTKYAYASRMFTGLTVGANMLEFGMSAQVRVENAEQSSGNTASQKYVQFDGRELVEGLDRLYADPRNINIPVSKASQVFVHIVARTPREVLSRMIEEYRKPGC